MPIYHLSAKTFGRAKGQSSTSAAAYRAASKIYDTRTGETHSYTRKQGVVFNQIIAPENAPEWVFNMEQLWNQVEAAEHRKNSTVAREVEVALPSELNAEQRQQLAIDLAREISAKHTVPVQVSIHAPHGHNDSRNHHVHLLFSTRRLVGGQLSEKTREWDDRKQGKNVVRYWRERWADLVNQALDAGGVAATVDHRSYKAQGVDKIPSRHLGAAAAEMQRRGLETRIGKKNAHAKKYNSLQDFLERISEEITQLRQTNQLSVNKLLAVAQRILKSDHPHREDKLDNLELMADKLATRREKLEKLTRQREDNANSHIERSEALFKEELAHYVDDVEQAEDKLYTLLNELETKKQPIIKYEMNKKEKVEFIPRQLKP